MRRYIRPRYEGAEWFVTVVLADRYGPLRLTDHIGILRDAITSVRKRWPFRIAAIVILPDHWHALFELPDGDADISKRIMLIKSTFSRRIPVTWEKQTSSRNAKRERGIWQRRFHDHVIHDDRDRQRHMDYIHCNPVRHGLVPDILDWPYSSIHRYPKPIDAEAMRVATGCDIDAFDDSIDPKMPHHRT